MYLKLCLLPSEVNHPPKQEDVKLVRVSKIDQNNQAKSWKHASTNQKPSSTNVERPADLPRALLQRRSRRRSGRHARRIKRLVPPPRSSLHEITRKLTFCWARDSVTVAHARSTCTRQACHTAPPHNCHPQLYSWQSTVLTYFIICVPHSLFSYEHEVFWYQSFGFAVSIIGGIHHLERLKLKFRHTVILKKMCDNFFLGY